MNEETTNNAVNKIEAAYAACKAAFGTGRYSGAMLELTRDLVRTRLVRHEDEIQAILKAGGIARAAITEFSRHISQAPVEVSAKLSKNGYTVREMASTKLTGKSPALDLIHAAAWLCDCGKHACLHATAEPSSTCTAWMNDIAPITA